MKTTFYAIILSLVFIGCKQGQLEKNYSARAFSASDDFNGFSQSKQDVLSIVKTDSGETKDANRFSVKFKDTTIAIEDNKKVLGSKLAIAKFINTQKTAMLVQIAGKTGSLAPFYIISLKDGKPEIVSLARPSTGKSDQKFTIGLEELTLTSVMMVNNDFIITTVNSRVFPLKRENPDERIQGKFFMLSPDRNTVAFLTDSSIYQVNYMSGTTLTLPVPAKILSQPESINQQIQQNYSWQENNKGISFLRSNADDNRVVDISEFKH
jgi:hypothetical protein